MRTISSIGLGHDPCRPGPSNCSAPLPTGLPKRRMIARSCEGTVKIPEKKKSITSPTIKILTMTKLLRNASESAREPTSSMTAGFGCPGGGGGVVPAATCSVVRGGSCLILSRSLMTSWIQRVVPLLLRRKSPTGLLCAVLFRSEAVGVFVYEQVEWRNGRIDHQRGPFPQRAF